MKMFQRVSDFCLHEPEFGRETLQRRLAEVGVQRGEQAGFVSLQRGGELPELFAPEVQRTRRARFKQGTVA